MCRFIRFIYYIIYFFACNLLMASSFAIITVRQYCLWNRKMNTHKQINCHQTTTKKNISSSWKWTTVYKILYIFYNVRLCIERTFWLSANIKSILIWNYLNGVSDVRTLKTSKKSNGFSSCRHHHHSSLHYHFESRLHVSIALRKNRFTADRSQHGIIYILLS